MSIAQSYSIIFLYTVIVLTLIVAFKLSTQDYDRIIKGENNASVAFCLCTFLAVWLGLRPPTYEFSDTGNYALLFNMSQAGQKLPINASEWLWYSIIAQCSKLMDVSAYLSIISLGYFLFHWYACKKLISNNVLAAVIFTLGAFSFYSYSVNGIRNGLACSICLSAIAVLSVPNKKLIIGLCLAFICINIHRSTILPIVSLFASIYIIKSFKWAYYFWIISIIISLVAGGPISSFFAGLGFDDRVSYINSSIDTQKFSYSGFRWDFLIYSMMPIILGYYVVIKRNIKNHTYLILLNTYTLANAFWVMVIRANFSNRFAYLSWFMYPIVLAYPLFKLNIWGDKQGQRTAQIMLAHVGFTWFMYTIF